jgi:hypothetical protein
MTMSKFSKYSAVLPPSVLKNPIPSFSKVKKIDKLDRSDTDKTEWIKSVFFMDIDNPSSGSKYSRNFTIFKDGCPEEWIKWLNEFCPGFYSLKNMEEHLSTSKERKFLLRMLYPVLTLIARILKKKKN